MRPRRFLRRMHSGAASALAPVPVPDTTPDDFSFAPVSGVARNSPVESAEIQLSGMTAAAPFTVVGGSLIVNGEDKGATGTAPPNPAIRAKLTSSGSYSTIATALVTVGDVSASFEVTTEPDPTPTPTPAPNITSYRGALTKAGAAGVNLGQLVEPAFTATSSTLEQTGGTAGHWILPTNGTHPTPSTTGAAAGLNGGPYTFAYNATDGIRSVSGTLSINVRANTITISSRPELAALNSAAIDGKTIEFARGASTTLGPPAINAVASSVANALYFNGLRTTGANRCTVRHEDAAKPSTIGPIVVRLCRNLTFDGIEVTPHVRQTPNESAYCWNIWATSPSTNPDCVGIVLNNCGVSGRPGDVAGNIGSMLVKSQGDVEFTANGFASEWSSQGLFFDSNSGGQITANFTGLTSVRYYTKNAWRIDCGPLSPHIHFDVLVMMSPMFDPTQAGVHPDAFQIQNGEDCEGITVGIIWVITADGDSSSQAFWTRQAVPGGGDYSLVGMTIDKFIYTGRTSQGLIVSGSDASHPFRINFFIGITQWSGIFGVQGSDGSSVWNNRPGGTENPGYSFDAGNTDLQATNVFVQGAGVNNSGITLPSSVIAANATSGDISAYYPNAGWISSAALRTTALTNNVDNFTGNADARWTDTIDEVLAHVKAALSGSLNGAPDASTW